MTHDSHYEYAAVKARRESIINHWGHGESNS
jgi:hypothetical protein